MTRRTSIVPFGVPVLRSDVSLEATWRGNLSGGVVPNKVFPLLEGTPRQLVFTPNSETPLAVAVDCRSARSSGIAAGSADGHRE